jgi:hypothetical protein
MSLLLIVATCFGRSGSVTQNKTQNTFADHMLGPAYKIKTLRKSFYFVTKLIDILTNILDITTGIMIYCNNWGLTNYHTIVHILFMRS